MGKEELQVIIRMIDDRNHIKGEINDTTNICCISCGGLGIFSNKVGEPL